MNDLSIHDTSRDLCLASTQRSADLKEALEKEKEKSKELEKNMERLDDERRKADELLYR